MNWIRPVAIAVIAALMLLFLGRLIDFWQQPELIWGTWKVGEDPDTARTIIISMLEVLAGVFAIAITVVAIIVQLSATRYTSRVVDLFLADPINRALLFAYVIPLIFGFWLADSITEQTYSPSSMTLFSVVSTLAIVLVIPYFHYLFRFLQPANIIAKIEAASALSIRQARDEPGRARELRSEVKNSIQQLSDISQASVTHSDISLALDGLESLKSLTVFYLREKPQLPDAWFSVNRRSRASDDSPEIVTRDPLWLEMQIFKRFEIAFTSSLRKFRDITSCAAISLRDIGVAAVRHNDEGCRDFIIKSFNTLIMYALSERDIRTAVHVFYQYRLFAAEMLDQSDVLARVAEYFKYYAHNSQKRGIFFITDTVAYDLRVLIMECFEGYPETAERLLDSFLQLDQEADSWANENRLRGIRKSQAILGAFFIRRGREDLARRIASDIEDENPGFLRTVREELFTRTFQEFWEIEDRGVTFYHVGDGDRASMEVFFSWILPNDAGSGKATAT
ncbi:MAG: DUF2254 family protein [Xanthomonadales bacterium]|nr:DUF2254 family protein [Xanthomonadales bacterium]